MKNLKTVLKTLPLFLLLLFISACSTGDRKLETPQGERAADQIGPWEILGVISRNTSSKHQPNASHIFKEDVTINVPVETIIIVPAMRGWATGYGSTIPDDLSANVKDDITWNSEDHNLGLMHINIFVKDIDAPDYSVTPPTQTATITVVAYLSDDNSDDSWWSSVNYNLLCLGKKKNNTDSPIEKMDQPIK